MRGIIGGCGCFVVIIVIAVAAFALGTVYGPEAKKQITQKSSSIVKSAKKRFNKICAQIKNAQTSADSLTGTSGANKKDKEEDSDERKNKRNDDINSKKKSVFDIEKFL